MRDVTLVVGNPRIDSRTLALGKSLAANIGGNSGGGAVIDLATLGHRLLVVDDPMVLEAEDVVKSSRITIFASPTYRATYTGLLKVFLDRLPSQGLAGSLAFAVMVGAGARHAMAADLLLKPVLVELGAICPVRGLYVLESECDGSPVIDEWLRIVDSTCTKFLDG